MPPGEAEYWGRPVSDVIGVNVWGFWFALIMLFTIFIALFLLSLITLKVAISAFVGLVVLGMYFDLPLVLSLLSIQPDYRVYENGIVLYFRLRKPQFHGWNKFKGYRWDGPEDFRLAVDGAMGLVPDRDKGRPRPPYLVLGNDLKDPLTVWTHISERLSRLD
jgi:hypothetical protein